MVLNLYLFKIIFRHKWDKYDKTFSLMFNKYSIGLWIKPYLAIAKKTNYQKDKKLHHVRGYLIGLDLIFIKTWIDVCFGKSLQIPME